MRHILDDCAGLVQSGHLTHWGRVTHICVNKLTIIGSDNSLSPGRCQAIIWTNAGILLIGHLGTNFSEILIEIYTFSFKKMHLKMLSGKWRPSCLGLNVLMSRDWTWLGRVSIGNSRHFAHGLDKLMILICWHWSETLLINHIFVAVYKDPTFYIHSEYVITVWWLWQYHSRYLKLSPVSLCPKWIRHN